MFIVELVDQVWFIVELLGHVWNHSDMLPPKMRESVKGAAFYWDRVISLGDSNWPMLISRALQVTTILYTSILVLY